MPVLSPPPSPLLDLRSVFNDRDECEAGPPELSASENSSHASVKGNLSIVSVSGRFWRSPSYLQPSPSGKRCLGQLSRRKPDLLRSGAVRDRQRRCSTYGTPNPDVLVLSAVGCPDFSVQGLETYPMTAAKRGRCLIINNCNFRVSTLQKREGTMVDEGRSHGLLTGRQREVSPSTPANRIYLC